MIWLPVCSRSQAVDDYRAVQAPHGRVRTRRSQALQLDLARLVAFSTLVSVGTGSAASEEPADGGHHLYGALVLLVGFGADHAHVGVSVE